jgi:hypothetical protein
VEALLCQVDAISKSAQCEVQESGSHLLAAFRTNHGGFASFRRTISIVMSPSRAAAIG